MGVFSKLKNIFYDEEIVEEPDAELTKVDKEVKKEIKEEKPKVEEIKVLKPEPIVVEDDEKEEPKLEKTVNERDLFRSERSFNFTELDEEDITLPPRRNVLDMEKDRSLDRPSLSTSDVEQPKIFKPSPIISPIYGILDKDYKKEEIVSKKTESSKETDSPARDYDSVRRKAYGTLEDDLEDTLNSMNRMDPIEIKEEEKKEVVEEKTSKIEDLITKIDESTEDVSIGELEDKLELEHFDDTEEQEPVDKTMTDSTLEHDLFNLIDSMYDDKEE